MAEPHRILLVEDDSDVRLVALLALRDVAGFVVETCESGKEALEKARVFRPDLVLLDVMLPELDGPSTLREMRRQAETAATPVIFVTAKAQPEEIAEYVRIGALGVIVKPFDPLTLGAEVRRIWIAGGGDETT